MPAPAPTDPIGILIIDRDKLVREGLRRLMLDRPTLQVVGEAENRNEALSLVKDTQSDVILLELDLGADNGLELLSTLLLLPLQSRVIVLTNVMDSNQHRKAMVLGAMGVVLKRSGSEVLFKAIEKVHAGEIWYDRSKMGGVFRDILQSANGRNANPIAAKIETLTPREHEVITLVSLGLKNRDIGERLFISETTVRHHLTSVFEKLEVSNRLELIIFAFGQGLAKLPDKTTFDVDESGKAITNLLELPSM